MVDDAALIERLLYEEEGTTLDFKRDQYPFAGCPDADKSELLKDILAFANGWRREDAYILVGVQEVRGGKSIVYGVTVQLDDASIQQFVNSKTQRPVEFSYRAATHDGKQVGIIHLPVQQRPFYLVTDFGNLKKETVYLRRGSSTDIADPDEVAKMGELAVASRFPVAPEPVKPNLQLTQTWIRYPIYPYAPRDKVYNEATPQARIAAKLAPPTFAVVQVSNAPVTRTPTSTVAERVTAVVTYYADGQPNARLQRRGVWITSQKPWGAEWMPLLSDDPVTIESGSPKFLALLEQFDDQTDPPRCHALDATSCEYDKWQNPSLEFRATTLRIHLRVEGQWEVKECEFTLSAEGGGYFAVVKPTNSP